jgi:V8-like Glu-specific endopeptidase
MELQKSIVAILDDQNKIIGTGFVAGENLILTCAHVFETATAGLNEQVTVRFAADGSKTVARASRLRHEASVGVGAQVRV